MSAQLLRKIVHTQSNICVSLTIGSRMKLNRRPSNCLSVSPLINAIKDIIARMKIKVEVAVMFANV